MARMSRIRTAALAGTSVIALSLGAATAQVVTSYQLAPFDPTAIPPNHVPGTFEYSLFIFGLGNDQFSTGEILAENRDNQVVVIGPITDSNVVVTVDAIASIATGNTTSPSNSILDDTNSASEWGHRILSSQFVTDYGADAVIAAETEGNYIGAGLSGFTVDSLTVSGNQISATAMVNRVENGIVGVPSSNVVLAGASVSGTGSSGDIIFEIEDAHSSLANVQIAAGVEARAIVSNGLQSDPTGIGFANFPDANTGATYTVTRNTIFASLTGNSALNSISDPEAIEYAGSLAIVNAQSNVGGDYDSQVTGQQIGGYLGLPGFDFTGRFTVARNSISGSITGNAASNSIVFEEASVTGANAASSASLTDDGSDIPADIAGDFVIGSVQGNVGTPMQTDVSFSQILAIIGEIDASIADGKVTVARNSITSGATGNRSENSFTASGPEFSANAVIAGLQMNDGSPVTASTFNTTIGASLEASIGDGSVISVSRNTIGASATGNQSSSLMQIDAESIVIGNGELADTEADGNVNFGSVELSGGASAAFIGNVQTNYGGSNSTASLSSNSIGLQNANEDVSASTLAVNRNRIRAEATGNDTANGISLTGVNGTTTAAIGNAQLAASSVSASVTANMIGIDIGNAIDMVLSLSNNSIEAAAIGNTANNALAAIGFTDLTLGDADPSYSGFAGANAASASLAVVSSQEFRTNVTAEILGGSQIVLDGESILDSVVAINGNALIAAATGNDAANSLTIDSDNIVANGNATELFGAVSNSQTMTDDGSVGALVNGHEIGIGVSDTSNSTFSVSNNRAVAAADGNVASNDLIVTGTTHVSQQSDNSGFGYVLMSNQLADSTGSVTAGVQNVRMGIEGTSDGDPGSTISIAGNNQIAQARVNVALNTVNFGIGEGESGFTNLRTSAQLFNSQASSVGATATVSGGQIGSGFAETEGSTQAVSDNSMQALGVGNASQNQMNVAAVQLSTNYAGSMPADFHVLNGQSNSGAISSTVNLGQIGIGTQAAPQEILGGVASVVGNQVSARSVGNSASNSLNIAAVSSTAIAAVSNSQVNVAAINSTVTGVNIGIFTTGDSSVNATVRGNSITASATGNSAVNSMTRSNY